MVRLRDTLPRAGADMTEAKVQNKVDSVIASAGTGKTVLVSSLQLSSTSEFLPKGYEPFQEMTKIMPWATSIDICPAVCYKCGADAFYTERLAKEEKKVLVGGAESYQPVCYKHSVMGKQ